MKKILILLTILLLAISCSNSNTNPNNATTGNGKPEVEIDPNKANIQVSTYEYMSLPIQVIIVGSDNKEISIGQLTYADQWNESGYYYKVFTFTPGTYTLIIRPAKNDFIYEENRYENLSFSAGTLEEYKYN